MTRNRIALAISVLLLAAAGLGAAPERVLAQCVIEQEVDEALALIERASEVVEKSDLLEARELLRAARVRVKEAGEAHQRGERLLACRLAVVAQNLARKAAEVAEAGLRGIEQLEGMLHKTDEFLQDTAGTVRASGVPEAVRLLRVARDQQNEAWNAFRSRRPRVAIKLTTLARNTAQRAERLSQGDAALTPRNLEEELSRTDRLFEEAVRALGEGARESEALTSANRLQAQARRNFQSDRPHLALRLTHQARVLIRRALRQSDVQVSAEDVETMIRSTSLLVEDLYQAAQESGSDKAADLLERAENLLETARKSLRENDLRSAFGSARAASALALDVSEMLERGEEE